VTNPSANAPLQTRRDLMIAMAIAGVASSLNPLFGTIGHAATSSSNARDWDWLVGSWDVWHRRLKERLAGSNDWEEFNGKSVGWLILDGWGNVDDNIVDIPSGTYRGLTVRAFDPATRTWAIWWLDGRNPTQMDVPVRGSFDGDSATFVANDHFKGRPIIMRFRWLDVHSKRPHWEQAFSTDGGKTWEVNWVNFFTRTDANPASLPKLDDASGDFDFLAGSWQVRNRRWDAATQRWREFDSTLSNRSVLGGHGNVGDNLFQMPGAEYRGVSVRSFDRDKREWLSWWLDGRKPASFTAPLRGSFKDGVGTLLGDDELDGKAIKVRSQWSRITAASAHWEQAASLDGGKTWQTNWVADFARRT